MTDETPQDVSPAEAATPVVEPTESAPVVETPEQPTEARRHEDTEKSSVQKRFDEMTWRLRETERREAALLEMLQKQHAPEPAKVEPAKVPALADFEYDEAKYQAALVEYATKQAEQVVERRLSEAESQRAQQKRLGTYAERQQTFAKATPDFEDKVLRDPTLPISEAMRDVIVDSDVGPEIAYYLADHRDEAELIARLPPHMAALRLGKIEARLEFAKEAKARPVAPVVTKAPPPPPTIEAAEPSLKVSTLDPESDKAMTDDEWVKAERARMNRKAKRNG